MGVKEVRKCAKSLARASSIIDLGCSPGFPITVVLVEEGLQVFGVDGAPSIAAAFQDNLPSIPIACESIEESRFFNGTFDAVLAIGLIFLLGVEDQHRLIRTLVTYFDSRMIASAAFPATTQLADPATTASSSNQRNPKSSMHSGKSGLMMMYPGITAPGIYALSARLLL